MTIRWAFLKRVLAGAIFGLYMAHLLYFLNPQVEITPARLATVTVVYGITCGLLFGSILWGLRALRVRIFGKRAEYLPHGFGFVVFAAFISAFIYWMHLELLRIYLPIGAVRILSKATNAITLTSFILLALWVIERNANRRLSRSIFIAGVVIVAISSFFLYQRRDSYRSQSKEVVVASIGQIAGHRPVILIAVRNLPYDWIVQLKGEGLVPFFERATETSYFTRLEPFPTTHWKSLWASLATGKLPHRHGVTGRFSYRTPLNRQEPFLLLPYGVGFRAWGLIPPVERIDAPLPSGTALPVWALFQRLQLSSMVVKWPSVATPPLPPADITDVEHRFDATGNAKQQILAGLASDLAATQSLDGDHEFSAVALEGSTTAQRALHIFLNELPARGSMKGEALRQYAQRLDRVLGNVSRAYPDHVIVICSPSAVVPPELPANVFALGRRALSREDPGADDGFLLITGPVTAHRENPQAAHVSDIVPTILFAAGLPVGRDMDGRILTDAFTDEMLRSSVVSAIQTYEADRVVVRHAP